MNNIVPNLSIGFMNDDHQAFELLLKRLQLAVAAQNVDETGDLFKQLHMEARQHFEQEEAVMQSINFPPYATHKRNHDGVLNELEKQWKGWQVDQNWVQLQQYLDADLRDWFYQHITTMDAMTAKFLAQKGIS